MHAAVEDFTELPARQLVLAYNAGQTALGRDEDSHIKKFRDSKTGVARLEKTRSEILAMFGYAQLVVVLDDLLEWVVDRPKPPREDPPPEEQSVAVSSAARGKTNLDLSLPVRRLVSINPKKHKSRAWRTFEVYRVVAEEAIDGHEPTGEEFVAAMLDHGFTRRLALATLHWDIDHGFIKLGD